LLPSDEVGWNTVIEAGRFVDPSVEAPAAAGCGLFYNHSPINTKAAQQNGLE
jgi:hypothetical protein